MKRIKNKYIIILGIVLLVIALGFGINYCLYSPSPVNKYIATNFYKTPANNYFTDDVFYQCVVDAYNEQNSTSVSYTTNLTDNQLNTIENLDCSYMRMENLEGLEKLTLLKNLYLKTNDIETIDLSNNTNLHTLELQNNNLATIDLSKNTKIVNLDLGYNELTAIDLSNLVDLEAIKVQGNKLTAIDLSKNTKLRTVVLGYGGGMGCGSNAFGEPECGEFQIPLSNQITSLDLTNNIELKELIAEFNLLSQIKFNKNSKIESIDVTENDLETIDLEGLEHLKTVYAFSNKINEINLSGTTNLEELWLSDNLLTEIDLTDNLNLTSLGLDDNFLTSIDLTNHSKLESLSIGNKEESDNYFTNLDLTKNINLYFLDIENTKLIELDLSENVKLDYLNIKDNNLSNLNLKNNINLTDLFITANKIVDLDLSENINMSGLFLFDTGLTELDLTNNLNLNHLAIKNSGITDLELSNNKELYTLGLKNTNITNLDVSNLNELSNLELPNNNLTELDLSKNTNLTNIELSNNNITNIDLTKNIQLWDLNLSNNNITNIDLTKNIQLSYLDLSNNNITNIDLTKNIQLWDLNLSNNNITDLVLSNNAKLDSLYLSNNNITELDLSNNRDLSILYSDNNKLNEINLDNNIYLKYLNLSNNNLENIDLSKHAGSFYNGLYLADNNLKNINLYNYFDTNKIKEVLGNQKANQTSIYFGEYKSIIPNDEYEFYINSKIVIPKSINVEVFIENLGLENLYAKVFRGNIELTNSNVLEGDILKIYDWKNEIQSIPIHILSNEVVESGMFQDVNFSQCVVDMYNDLNETNVSSIYELSDKDLKTITYLNCPNRNISDVSGIEKLSNLISINLDENQIKNIYLGEITNLNSLQIRNNQLIDLDVYNNLELKYLNAGNDISKDNFNQIAYIDLSNNKKLTTLYLQQNQIPEIDLSNNIELTNLDLGNSTTEDGYIFNHIQDIDLSNNENLEYIDLDENLLKELNLTKNTKLKSLSIVSNSLTNIDLSKNIELYHLVIFNNKLTSLDLTKNTKLSFIMAHANDIATIDFSNNLLLEDLYISGNQLTELDISKNTKLKILSASENKLSDLNLINNLELTELNVANNRLTSLDVSKNLELKSLSVGSFIEDRFEKNKLTKLDLSKNTKLENLSAFNNKLSSIDLTNNKDLKKIDLIENLFEYKLKPVLLGETVTFEATEEKVKLYDGFEYGNNYYFINDIGTRLDTKEIETTNAGTIKIRECYYSATHYAPIYEYIYNVEVVDVKSDTLVIDKTKDYIEVLGFSNEEVLNNIVVENGEATIENGYLVIKNGEDEVKRFELKGLKSSKYDLTNDYVYVGTDNDEEIINNIETSGEISISNNILNITTDGNSTNYTLIRVKDIFGISEGYAYISNNEDYNEIEIINGNKNIVENNIVISYNDVELDRIPIIRIESDNYIIGSDYIFAGFSDINLNKINSINANLDARNNTLIISYKENIIDEIPYYYLKINSPNIRYDDIKNKIYIEENMSYTDFIDNVDTNQDIISFNIKNNNQEIINSGTLEEGYILEVLYENNVINNYTIEFYKEYVDYTEDLDIEHTEEYGKDIIKNLNINLTFIDIRTLINTNGDISILDKNNQILEDNNKIKTGDKLVIEFPNYSHIVHLSIKGDVTGTGNIQEEDVNSAYKILRNEIKVEIYYELAADVKEDGQVKINDIAKLYQYVKNKIESLED